MDTDSFEPQNDLTNLDLERISKSGIVAIDCEMGGLNPNRDQLYLVQISDRNDVVNLIKTSQWHQAVNLKSIMVSKNIIKVFHFAIIDNSFLNKHLSIVVENAYCTKIASKLARTYSDSHGLGSLLEDLFGLEKDKKLQTSYWGGHITKEQTQYAIKDVKHLIKIKSKLESILAEKGTLPTGITYLELNNKCQQFIPALTQLWLNGWDFGIEDPKSVFGH